MSGMTTTVAITKPVVTQVISSTVAPSEPVRCGVATVTIDVSMAPMSVPNVTDKVTSHLLTGARARRRREGGRGGLTRAALRAGARAVEEASSSRSTSDGHARRLAQERGRG